MRVSTDVEIEISDPACVADIFVEGVAAIEKIGNECIRYTLYASRRGDDGVMERVVVVRLVYPRTVAMTVNRQSRAFLDGEIVVTPDMPIGIVPN